MYKQNDKAADQNGASASLGQVVDYMTKLFHSNYVPDNNRNDQGGDQDHNKMIIEQSRWQQQ